MGFSLGSLAVLSGLATLAASAVIPVDQPRLLPRTDGCNGPNWAGNAPEIAPVTLVGPADRGVAPFCIYQLPVSGAIIREMAVYSDGGGITGIVFTDSNNATNTQGFMTGQPKTITFAAGETITQATMWGDGTSSNLGKISLTTTAQSFEAGATTKSPDQHVIAVGGGLLVGASGNIGTKYMDNLQLLFLAAKIESINIGSITYDTAAINSQANTIKPAYLVQSTMGNPKDNDVTVPITVTGTETVTTTSTYDQSTTGTFGMSATVSLDAAPLGVGGSVSSGYTWSVAHTSDTSTANTDTITLTNTQGPIQLKPGEGQTCTIVAGKGTGNFPYSSTVTINLTGGTKITYQETGQLNSVQYSSVQGSCVPENNPANWKGTTNTPPQGFSVGNGKKSS